MSDLELDKKLAEWSGWEYRRSNPHHFIDNPEAQKRDYAWYHPNSSVGYHNCPDFTQSHDLCDQWLVPKLFRECGIVELRCKLDSRRDGDGYRWALYTYKGFLYHSDFLTSSPLALCKAIEQLIDREAKNEGKRS